jgi:hypothetical protein
LTRQSDRNKAKMVVPKSKLVRNRLLYFILKWFDFMHWNSPLISQTLIL